MITLKKTWLIAVSFSVFVLCMPVSASTTKSGWTVFEKARTLNTEGLLSMSVGKNSLSGVFYNPASLGMKKSHQLEFASESGFANDKLGRMLYGFSYLGGECMIGGAYYDAGSVELNWIDNNSLQSQTVALQKDMLGILSYSRKLSPKVYAGVSVKGATSEIAQSEKAAAYAADMGVMYQLSSPLVLSLSLLNTGTSTKFIDQNDPLPQMGFAGAIYTLDMKRQRTLELGAGSYYHVADQKNSYEAGATFRFLNYYLHADVSTDGTQQSVSYGGGIEFQRLSIGYAMTQTTYIDAIQRLTVGVKFGPARAHEVSKKTKK